MSELSVCERIGRVQAVDVARADIATLDAALAAVAAAARWVDAQQTRLAGAYAQLSVTPELGLAHALQVPFRDAETLVKRAGLTDECPTLAEALACGRLSGAHIDVILRSLTLLTADERACFLAGAHQLVVVGERLAVDRYREHVRRVRDRVRAPRDPDEQIRRQREATRLALWVDRDSGMWCLHGEFDPAAGLLLANAIKARTESLFHDRHPDTAPSDPIARQQHLRALAFADLVLHGGAKVRVDVTGIVDLTDIAPGGVATIDWGLPGIEIDPRVLAGLQGKLDVNLVVVRNGVVLHAPGEMDLGRTRRHASRAQRRALSALYATCGVPGCSVPYDDCILHHLVAWSKGGRTDLANLFPLCTKHHHHVHDRGWVLDVGPNREVTLATPDGKTMTTGPPRRRTA